MARKLYKVTRTNKHTKTRVLWYVTGNHCDKKAWMYHDLDVKDGGNATICDKCAKGHRLTRKGAEAEITL